MAQINTKLDPLAAQWQGNASAQPQGWCQSDVGDTAASQDSRRAGRGLVAMVGAKVVFILTSYGIQLALPRILEAVEFGRYRSALLGVSLINNLVIASTIQSVSKFVSEDESRTGTLFGQALRLQALVGGLLAASLFTTAPYWASLLRDDEVAPLLRVGALVVLFYAIYGAIVGVLNGQRLFAKQAGLDMTFSVLRTVGFLGGAIYGATALATLTGWMFAAGALLLLAFIVAAVHLRGKGEPLAWSRWVGFMAPVWLYQFSLNAMLLIDVQVLKRTVADLATSSGLGAEAATEVASEQVAYYGAAQTFAMVPYQLILSLTFIVFPMVSRATSAGDEAGARSTIRVATRFALIVLLALAAPISGAARGTLLLAFPEEYVAGAPALEVLVFGMVALGLYLILATALTSAGRAFWAALIALTSTSVVIVVGRIFVLGSDLSEGVVQGAAIGTSCGMGVAFLLAAGAITFRFGFPFTPQTLLRSGIAAVVGYGVAHYMPHETRIGALAALILGGLSYLATLAITRELTLGDLRAARASLSRKPSE